MGQKNYLRRRGLGNLGWGVFFLGAAALIHNIFEQFEASGGSLRIHVLIALAYNLGGKWGAVMLFVIAGCALFWAGFKDIRDS
jgi:hypothetical protein